MGRQKGPVGPIGKKRKLQVIDGEQRGLKAPFGATKEQAIENQRRRDIQNFLVAARDRARILDANVIVLELSEVEMDFVKDLVDSHIGDCREAVVKFILKAAMFARSR